MYTPFASGPIDNDNILDYLFGISIVIVLLNVIIAIVTQAWEDATDEADKAFWSYRLDLILEKTRGIDEDRSFRATLRGCFGGLDDLYIDIETVGTTTDELKAKLATIYREKGPLFCLIIIAKSIGWIILGFPTLGVLWPKFFRQLLFTPPKPKKDETKTQLDYLVEEVAKLKQLLSKER